MFSMCDDGYEPSRALGGAKVRIWEDLKVESAADLPKGTSEAEESGQGCPGKEQDTKVGTERPFYRQ